MGWCLRRIVKAGDPGPPRPGGLFFGARKDPHLACRGVVHPDQAHAAPSDRPIIGLVPEDPESRVRVKARAESNPA
jgi:hypothetical protein